MLAIDPGLNNLGYAMMPFNTRTKQLEGIEAHTVTPEKLPDYPDFRWCNPDYIDDRAVKLLKISNTFAQLVQATEPHVIVMESPFFNPTRPTAFKALTEAIWAIRSGVYSVSGNITFHWLAPQQMKAHISAIKKDAGKDYVRERVMGIPEVQPFLLPVIDELSEHAVDAVGVGFVFLKIIGELR